MSNNRQKAIFLDRDGVINKEVGYLHKSKDFEFIDGVFEACKYFQKLGYKLIVVTNQSGIARGYYQEENFHTLTKSLLTKVLIYSMYFSVHMGLNQLVSVANHSQACC